MYKETSTDFLNCIKPPVKYRFFYLYKETSTDLNCVRKPVKYRLFLMYKESSKILSTHV